MKKISLTQKVIITLIGALTLIACSKDNSSNQGVLAISAKSTYNKSTTTNKGTNATINITDFLINLKEFKLEADQEHENEPNESWDDDGRFDYEDDVKLQGPFELDVLAGQLTFVSVAIPDGTYKELKFKFGKSTNADSQLLGKSILLKGTIDNTPFVFWHNFQDEMEVDFKNRQQDIVVQNNAESVTINFDLNAILNVTGGVDLSLARDLNNDGLIEISPVDVDGNNALAQQLRTIFRNHIELHDDNN